MDGNYADKWLFSSLCICISIHKRNTCASIKWQNKSLAYILILSKLFVKLKLAIAALRVNYINFKNSNSIHNVERVLVQIAAIFSSRFKLSFLSFNSTTVYKKIQWKIQHINSTNKIMASLCFNYSPSVKRIHMFWLP